MESYKHYLLGQCFRQHSNHEALKWPFNQKEPKHKSSKIDWGSVQIWFWGWILTWQEAQKCTCIVPVPKPKGLLLFSSRRKQTTVKSVQEVPEVARVYVGWNPRSSHHSSGAIPCTEWLGIKNHVKGYWPQGWENPHPWVQHQVRVKGEMISKGMIPRRSPEGGALKQTERNAAGLYLTPAWWPRHQCDTSMGRVWCFLAHRSALPVQPLGFIGTPGHAANGKWCLDEIF